MNSRNQSLDVLRAMAILLVLCTHYTNLNRSFLKLGGIGVDLFFVLSGFLISGLLFSELQKTGSIGVGRFLMRRGLKIYPAFYAFLLLTAPMLIGTVPSFGSRLANEVIFLQPYRAHIWEHTWSLGVEEHFYLFLPVVLLGLHRARRLDLIPWIASGLIVLCSLGRISSASAPSNTHLRIDELFDGVLLGYFSYYRPAFFKSFSSRRWLPFVGICLVIPWFAGDTEKVNGFQSLRITAASLGFSAFVWWSQRVSLRNRLLELIGRHSYSIYLWHMPVALLWSVLSPMNPLGFLLCSVSSVGVGIFMAKIVELPVLKWRDKVFPSVKPKISSHSQSGPATSVVGATVIEGAA